MEKKLKYMLICPDCNHRIFTDGSDVGSLTEVKTAPIPLRADGKSKEIQPMPKKFRCPECGHILRIIKLDQPEEKKEDKRDEPEIMQHPL